ncbi:Spore coat polysaccharide biosynthesis protein SpsF, cytidylyltransferase family [Nostoc flagelliforme CCNUN1]|uniref:Spore coat polysaccharide biosynthesis protein SpsF, cytidylyltransferase family n=1 Tax=Nostoc flagelliforme CCNUN1 TaxID=2038116 RepID=A0A2K8SJ78_9NOSO|nr:transposase [Nostoc flagelliforme]AUB35534.1 Spore coat polysaccharide biosynthesis protein SpsF, cytidylyltransferase family [Nostoc flagelliforme CCNUN1]
MTPNKNDCIPEQFRFGLVKSCPVVVNFNGEPVTSDAGLILIAELDRKREITSRLVACFKDYREPNKILHPVNGLIAQRIYGLIMGYEDVNDHETLRHDGIFALAVGKAINLEQEPITLAGKSTLNRIEHCPEDISSRADSRYHRIEHDASAIETLLVELFLVVEFFETLFPPSPDLKNDAAVFVDNSVWYCSLDYQTLDSWSRQRRVVAKVEYSYKEVDTRFVVTSLPVNKIPPGRLYTQKYCPRGNMENCLKEQKLGLHSDRTSTHTFEGNQLRLWFASIAYILMNALREQCLAKTEFKNATVEIIRTKLLKLGAVITIRKRRILIAISSACPYKEIFAMVYKSLSQLPCPG